MSLQTFTAAASAASFTACAASAMAGDILPTCSVCGQYACSCALSVYNANSPWNGSSYTTWTASWTCATCGQSMPFGASHICTSPCIPITPTIPNSNTFSYTLERECFLCDKMLDWDDKKVCKSCKAVFDAWKFLTSKPEPEPEKEE